jgi:hypothetical protein
MSLAETNHHTQNKQFLDGLVFILTRYYVIRNKTFYKLALRKKKVETTYPFLPWGVFVLSKVQSRSHHLTHQWSQIRTFAFGNHTTRHHIYFKNIHVHIQAFHILQSHNAIIIVIEQILICKFAVQNH